MPTLTKVRELADAFEGAYPPELPKRLEWWCGVLGTDRVRFLRMMGMSATEAKTRESEAWESILQDPTWVERGWLLEGRLHELLSLFNYDWNALSARLHQPLEDGGGAEKTRIQRMRGETVNLPYQPNGDGTEVLLNLMAERGPQALSAVLAYLSSATNGAGRRE